jgi:hypothetical protein
MFPGEEWLIGEDGAWKKDKEVKAKPKQKDQAPSLLWKNKPNA